jgi:hypothetical protein
VYDVQSGSAKTRKNHGEGQAGRSELILYSDVRQVINFDFIHSLQCACNNSYIYQQMHTIKSKV